MYRFDDDFIRPSVKAQPPMTAERFAELREQHRPYKAMAGMLCLACSLPNVPNDPMAPVTTFYPCVFARIFEYAESDEWRQPVHED